MKKDPSIFTALQKASREKGRTKYFLFFLVLSFFFWFASKFSRTYTEVITLELTLQKLPTEVIPLLNAPIKVEATLSATGFQFLYYTWINNTLDVDMTAAKFLDGKAELPLGAQFQSLQEQLLGDTQIINYFPTTVEFDYQQQYTKRVPVVTPQIPLALGYSAVSVTFSPDSIDLSGPKSVVDNINTITPLFSSDQTIKESFQTSVALPFLPLRVSALQTVIAMQVDVDRFSEQQFTVPVRLKNTPTGKVLKLYPETVEVTLSAPLEILKTLDPTAIELGVDFSEIEKSKNRTLSLRLFKAPDNIKNLRWTPTEIEYLIREK